MPIFIKCQDSSSSSSSSSSDSNEFIEYLKNLDSNARIVVISEDINDLTNEDNNEDNNDDRTNDNNEDNNEDNEDSGDSDDLNDEEMNELIDENEFLSLLKVFARHCLNENDTVENKPKIEQFINIHLEKLKEKKLLKKYPGQKQILIQLLPKYRTEVIKKFIEVFGAEKLEFFKRVVRFFPGKDETVHCVFDPIGFRE